VVDEEGVADDVPALEQHDARQEHAHAHQAKHPAPCRVGRHLVEPLLEHPAGGRGPPLQQAALGTAVCRLQHVLHHYRNKP